jgi:hypothetical protein
MFRSATDHHQGAHLFLIKITALKMWIFILGYVVMRQHNMFCFYVVCGVVRNAASHILINADNINYWAKESIIFRQAWTLLGVIKKVSLEVNTEKFNYMLKVSQILKFLWVITTDQSVDKIKLKRDGYRKLMTTFGSKSFVFFSVT